MNDLGTVLAERACMRVMTQYALYTDSRENDKIVMLFTKDGVLNRADTGEMKGREAIKKFFDGLTTDPLIHAASNLLVTVTGPETAEGLSYITVCRSYRKNATGLPKLEAPYVVLKYLDKFVVEDGQWRIAYRDSIVIARE